MWNIKGYSHLRENELESNIASKWDVKSGVHDKLAKKDRVKPASITDHVMWCLLVILAVEKMVALNQYFLWLIIIEESADSENSTVIQKE